MPILTGLFSSESVSAGHPDKLADQISDHVLDAFLAQDPKARVACETLLSDQMVVVAGEFKSRPEALQNVQDSIPGLVRSVLTKVGYGNSELDIDPSNLELICKLNGQSADISQGVDQSSGVIGAGDQGLMFGYACDETPELMPAALTLSHALVKRQSELVAQGNRGLRPDAKSQVTLNYGADGQITGVEKVVLSTQHEASLTLGELRELVIEEIITPTLKQYGFKMPSLAENLLINPTGRFVTGGPKGDCGLTGRKIIVDTYGGSAPHGGGAFSGKDPSKVDRSAAYMARHVAKSVVATGLVKSCLVQVAYAIGKAQPVSVSFKLEAASGVRPELMAKIEEAARNHFDFSVQGIIEHLQLQNPIYAQTAAYGHFGRRDLNLPWEKVETFLS